MCVCVCVCMCEDVCVCAPMYLRNTISLLSYRIEILLSKCSEIQYKYVGK